MAEPTAARSELEAIYIHTTLSKRGYLIQQDGDRWRVIEPNTRNMPQAQNGLLTMREVQAWAAGCEAIRFITGRQKRA